MFNPKMYLLLGRTWGQSAGWEELGGGMGQGQGPCSCYEQQRWRWLLACRVGGHSWGVRIRPAVSSPPGVMQGTGWLPPDPTVLPRGGRAHPGVQGGKLV